MSPQQGRIAPPTVTIVQPVWHCYYPRRWKGRAMGTPAVEQGGVSNKVLSLTPHEIRYYLGAYNDAIRARSERNTRSSAAGGETLVSLDAWYQGLSTCTSKHTEQNDTGAPGAEAVTAPPVISCKADLVRLMRWKLAREKFRPTLMSLIESNSETTVQDVLQRAYASLAPHTADSPTEESRIIDAVPRAMKVLAELRGVGPATASAITAVWNPLGVFQSDELANFLLSFPDRTNQQIKYDWKFYSSFYSAAMQMLSELRLSRADSLTETWSGRTMERLVWSIVHSQVPDEESFQADNDSQVAPSKPNQLSPKSTAVKTTTRKAPPASTPPKRSRRTKRSPDTQT